MPALTVSEAEVDQMLEIQVMAALRARDS